MRLATYEDGLNRSFGILTAGGIIDLANRLDVPDMETMLAEGLLEKALGFASAQPEVRHFRLLKPLERPGKCFCIGRNYPGRMSGPDTMPLYLFQRVPDSFSGPEEPLLRPPESTQFDYEAEIVVVIGTAGRRIPRERALDHVAGYMLANDGSLRDWTRREMGDVTAGKNFCRSGSLGPWITTRTAVGDGPFHLITRVNGEVRQDDSTDRMLCPVDKIISYISTFTALAPGDIILTGTPAGAGAGFDPPRWLKAGDVVEIEATGLGVLRNIVSDEPPPPA
ncbi:Fumarylacetoacetate hydrolase family protein [Rhodovastum atsumiense]|uniref:Fumarylacetoacetate hydrolase family protein n=1 Tax=Rhodovastum atsumiense TaxID=504468 RepID=A0A5M6IY40_9PROT|nr:fumarylacetoacetate hydrolase family protein [Rhodovastum atsumiense]KAA5613232.1 fumarylacetoacetate hydrolase family protein [Rhodovastum atsumiense]CAH2600612.1 Fumarylacetoacetate hydrolase family protein [Rhodovastum atsumiense]